MKLDSFESYIDKKILARGRDYYKNNYVAALEEIDKSVFEAEVQGTDLYIVVVGIDEQSNIVNSQCDCPYDLGDYCKHQVAVFLALRDLIKNRSQEHSHKQKNIRSVSATQHESLIGKNNKTIDLKKILSERTKDELIGFILVLEKARFVAAQKKTLHAIKLVLAVIHEMIDLLQRADDSDGTIGRIVEESFDFIDEIITDKELSPIVQEASSIC